MCRQLARIQSISLFPFMLNYILPLTPSLLCFLPYVIVTTQKTGPKSTTPKFRAIKRVYLNIGSPRKFNKKTKYNLKLLMSRKLRWGLEKQKITAILEKDLIKVQNKITTMLEKQTRTKDYTRAIQLQ